MSSIPSRARAGKTALASLSVLILLLHAGAFGATPPPKAPPGPQAILRADSATVEAGLDFGWTVPLRIVNPSEMGLYLDSLFCDLSDTSPGETRTDRHTRANLRLIISQFESLSGGDSVMIQHQSPAQFESGKLHYTFYGHRSNRDPVVLTADVTALPGAMAQYPSRSLVAGGRKVEWVFLPSNATGPSPGLVIVHGHGSHARQMLRTGMLYANQGYSVALVSMPGYGMSEGPPDLMGPATLAAVNAAADSLTRQPGVDRSRIGVVGFSRGATVAASLAESRKDVRALLLQSGIYDLWEVYRETELEGFRETIVAEAGTDSAAWKARSPVYRAASIHAPVLMVHGDRDRQAPVSQAHGFEAALRAANVSVEATYLPTATHFISLGMSYRASLGFFAKNLKDLKKP